MKKIFLYFTVLIGINFILEMTVYSATSTLKEKPRKEKQGKAEKKPAKAPEQNPAQDLANAKRKVEEDINKAQNRHRSGQNIQRKLMALESQITKTKKQAKALRENSLVSKLQQLQRNKNQTLHTLQVQISKINPSISSVKASSSLSILATNKRILNRHSENLQNLNITSLSSLNNYQTKLNSLKAKVKERLSYINNFREKEIRASKNLLHKARNEIKNVLNAIDDAKHETQRAEALKQRAINVNAQTIISLLNRQIENLYQEINTANRNREELIDKAHRLRRFIRSNNKAWPQAIQNRRLALKRNYKYFYSQDFENSIDNQADDLEALVYSKNSVVLQMEKELVLAKQSRQQAVDKANNLLFDWYDLQANMKGYLNKLDSLLQRARLARMNTNISNLEQKIQLSKGSKDQIENLIYNLDSSISSLESARYTLGIRSLIPVVERNYNNLKSKEYAYSNQLKALGSWLTQQENKIAVREAEIVRELVIAKAALRKVITITQSILTTGQSVLLENTRVSKEASTMLDRANKAYVDSSSQRISAKKTISDKALTHLTEQTNKVNYFLSALVVASYPTDVDQQTKNLDSYLPSLDSLQKNLKNFTVHLSRIVAKETPHIIKGERVLAQAQQLASQVLAKANLSLSKAQNLVDHMNETILKASSVQSRAKIVEKPSIAEEIETFKSPAIKIKDKVANNISKVQGVVNTLHVQRRPKNLDRVRLQLSPLLSPLDHLAQTLTAPRLALQNSFDKHLAVILRREKASKDRKNLIAKANTWVAQLIGTIQSSKSLVSKVEIKTIPEAKKYFKHINSTEEDISNLQKLPVPITEAIYRLQPILKQSRKTIAEYAQASLDEIEVNPAKQNQLRALESQLASESMILNQAYQSLKLFYTKVTEHINWRACTVVENKATSVKENMANFFRNHIFWNNNGRSDNLANQWMKLYNCKDLSKYQKDFQRLYDFAGQNLSAVLWELNIKDNLDFGVKYIQSFCSSVNIEKLFEETLEDLGGGCDGGYEDDDSCDVWDADSDNIEAAFKKIKPQAFNCSNLKIITK